MGRGRRLTPPEKGRRMVGRMGVAAGGERGRRRTRVGGRRAVWRVPCGRVACVGGRRGEGVKLGGGCCRAGRRAVTQGAGCLAAAGE
nr:unnamed protein product [Digitaria exilis]